MTLKELKEKIDWFIMQNPDYGELEVCIPNNKPGFSGGTPCTYVLNASKGIDWDSDKFIIYPEVRMSELKQENTN